MSKSNSKLHLYALGILFPLIGGIASLLLLTRLMSPAIFGKYALLLAVVEVLQTVIFQWHRMTVMRYYDDSIKSNTLNKLINASNSINIILILITMMISIVIQYVFDMEWWLIAVLAICKSMSIFAQEMSRVSENIKDYIKISIVQGLVILIFPNATYFLTKNINATILSLAVGYGLSVLPAMYFLKMNITKIKECKEKILAFKKYGGPLIYGFIAASFLSKFDKIIIGSYSSMEQLGGYAAISTIANGVAGASLGVIVSPFYPKILRAYNGEGWRSAKYLHGKIATIILAVALYVFCVFILSRFEIVHILLNPDYWSSATTYFIPTLLFVLLFGLKAHMVDQVFHVQAMTGILVKINIVCGILACFLSMLATKTFGAEGFLYTMIVAIIITMSIQVCSLDRDSNLHVRYMDWLKLFFCSITSYFMAQLITPSMSELNSLLLKTLIYTGIFFTLMYSFDFLGVRKYRNSLIEALHV